jgi:hypothetical protein
MTRAILAVTLMASGSWAAADEVWLKGGGRIVGEVLERRAQSVVIEVGPGTVTMPMARVDHIVSASSRLTEFRSRAARMAPGDVQGWLGLAAWADQNDLRTQAREAWEHVLAVDPTNSLAQQSLGNVWLAGRWMEHDNAMRAQGLVEFEGQWVTPGEREARLRIQASEAAAQVESAMADARVAEAEARVREAEARARAAEADAARAEDTSDDYGIPIYGYGAIGYGNPLGVQPVQGCCGGSRHSGGFRPNHPHGGRPSAPAPQPTPRDRNPQTTIPSNQRGTSTQG